MSIYKEVAKAALTNWYGKTDEEIKDIFNTTANKDLEYHSEYGVYGLDSITAGLKSYAKSINSTTILNMDDEKIHQAIIDEEPWLNNELKAKTAEMCANYQGDDLRLFKQQACVDALEAIHDDWVSHNKKKFFQEGRENKQYMHLPTQLIGWKDVELDLLFLKPVMDTAEINVDYKDVENEYGYRSDMMKLEMTNKNLKNIVNEYEPLKKQPDVLEAFENDEVLNHVAELSTAKIGKEVTIRPQLRQTEKGISDGTLDDILANAAQSDVAEEPNVTIKDDPER